MSCLGRRESRAAVTLHSHRGGSAFLIPHLRILDKSTQFDAMRYVLNLKVGIMSGSRELDLVAEGAPAALGAPPVTAAAGRAPPTPPREMVPDVLLQGHELRTAPLRLALIGSYFCHLAIVDQGTDHLCQMYRTRGVWVFGGCPIEVECMPHKSV